MTQAKSFLKEIDFTKQELEELIDLSIKFKQLKKAELMTSVAGHARPSLSKPEIGRAHV